MASETTSCVLGRLVTVSKGFPLRIGSGQWIRHDTVRCDGQVIGQLLIKNEWHGPRLGFQLVTKTILDGCPFTMDGYDLEWLVRQQVEAA